MLTPAPARAAPPAALVPLGAGLRVVARGMAALLALWWPLGAVAQVVTPCDWQVSAENLAEPWEDNTRTFANGAIRLAVLDTAEPAAAAFHLLVLSPPVDMLGLRQCRVVAMPGPTGFGFLTLQGATAAYDPARGLTVTLSGGTYDDRGQPVAGTVRVTINQATGQITANLDQRQ